MSWVQKYSEMNKTEYLTRTVCHTILKMINVVYFSKDVTIRGVFFMENKKLCYLIVKSVHYSWKIILGVKSYVESMRTRTYLWILRLYIFLTYAKHVQILNGDGLLKMNILYTNLLCVILDYQWNKIVIVFITMCVISL